MRRARRGFTLVEALAALVLITVGLVATLQCIGAMTRARSRALETADMQRLAFRKYDEIIAENLLPSGSSDGNFEDVGEPRFTWHAERTALGVGGLDDLAVQVVRKGETYQHATEVQGLICRPSGGAN